MERFGGALTESSGWVLGQLPPAKRAEVINRYFGADGIGYTLARTHINSCDFSLGSWSLDNTAGDTALAHFSLEPMRAWVLPLVHDAMRAAGPGNFHLLACPWSPPSWMKSNGHMAQGGTLRPEYAQTWANFFVEFIRRMDSEEHIPVWALTVQNEPMASQRWESCLFTAASERDFVRDHLGPALSQAGLESVHLLVLDHNRDLIDDWTKTILADPGAARHVWGTAVHWYVSQDFAAESRAHAAFPDKALLFTEGCCEGGGELGSWQHGESYAHSIINDFNNWICGWIDWNIVLDQEGGPNHVGNFCDAPVIVDTERGEIRYQSAFYYIGQFSRFVKPGAMRIASSASPGRTESVAFRNPNGSIVLVVLNSTDSSVSFSVRAGQAMCRTVLPAHAIQTLVETP